MSMKIGVVGLGYWGPNLVRNFLNNKNVSTVYACDTNPLRLKFIKTQFPPILAMDSYANMLALADLDAIAISTPVHSHYELAKAALKSGRHVWIEKPFTATSVQAQELIEIADKFNLTLFVDHTYIYTGAVRKIKKIIESNELGEIQYFDSVRINLGIFQRDVNVIWDLAPHDLSIMDYIIDKKIKAVTANGIANYSSLENIAHIALYFENNCYAHIHVNWTSPVKIREMIVGGNNKMLVFNDLENYEKIKIYDSGIIIRNKEDVYASLVEYRMGDMYSPKVDQQEALSAAVIEFVESIKTNRMPLTSGKDGLKIVKILEAADKSIKNRGILVDL